MAHKETCVRIPNEVFERVLVEVEKDAFITKKPNGEFFGRFVKNNNRFNESTDAFNFPLIGYVRGCDTYIKPSLLTYYVRQTNL